MSLGLDIGKEEADADRAAVIVCMAPDGGDRAEGRNGSGRSRKPLIRSLAMDLPFKVGDKLPDVRLGTMGGNSVAIRDYAGMKVLVFIWSSW